MTKFVVISDNSGRKLSRGRKLKIWGDYQGDDRVGEKVIPNLELKEAACTRSVWEKSRHC